MIRLLLALALAAAPAARVYVQVLGAKPVGEVLHVTAPGFTFLEGALLDRLKDGRSARLDLELSVLTRPKGSALAREKRSFTVSLDLWEERFTVSTSGSAKRAISHVRAADAEAWCVENVTMPVASFARQLRDGSFWVRLEYRVPDLDTGGASAEPLLTLRSLIDRLSKRPANPDAGKSVEGGPFRLGSGLEFAYAATPVDTTRRK